jgi:segregation and condensation protein B
MAKRSKKQSPTSDDENDPIAQPTVGADSQWGEISLEELGQAYAEAMAEVMGAETPANEAAVADTESTADLDDKTLDDLEDETEGPAGTSVDDDLEDAIPTPGAIIEAALFIGNPENRGITESELAALMRDVTAEDVSDYVDRLNESYIANGQAFRIHRDEDGLRLGVAPDMEVVRRAFYGKIRETRLSQPAIEVLSLVAYQPGITAEKVQDQRGKESASLLSQLVRRRLLEQRRVPVEGTKKMIANYHPTERFLQLFGLESLDDLPQVEP